MDRWFLIRLKLSASPDRHSKTRQHRPEQNRGRFGNGVGKQCHATPIAPATVGDEKDPDHRNLRFTKPDWFIAQYENTLSGPNQLLLDDDW